MDVRADGGRWEAEEEEEEETEEEAEGGGWSNDRVRRKKGRDEQSRTNGSLGWMRQQMPRYTQGAGEDDRDVVRVCSCDGCA
jgi:hypothetical protein